MGGKEDDLRRGYRDEEDGNWKMRDEPSDAVSEWCGVFVKGGRVTRLDWDDLGLTGTIPAETGALDGLTELYLFDNQICGHLPSEIGRLTSLTHLDLRNNRLEGPLPAELGALTVLAHLLLNHNNLTGEIPSTLANLTNLEMLSLYSNNFDDPNQDPFYPYVLDEGELYGKREVQEFLADFFNPMAKYELDDL